MIFPEHPCDPSLAPGRGQLTFRETKRCGNQGWLWQERRKRNLKQKIALTILLTHLIWGHPGTVKFTQRDMQEGDRKLRKIWLFAGRLPGALCVCVREKWTHRSWEGPDLVIKVLVFYSAPNSTLGASKAALLLGMCISLSVTLATRPSSNLFPSPACLADSYSIKLKYP